jgi:hypothetical protein
VYVRNVWLVVIATLYLIYRMTTLRFQLVRSMIAWEVLEMSITRTHSVQKYIESVSTRMVMIGTYCSSGATNSVFVCLQ